MYKQIEDEWSDMYMNERSSWPLIYICKQSGQCQNLYIVMISLTYRVSRSSCGESANEECSITVHNNNPIEGKLPCSRTKKQERTTFGVPHRHDRGRRKLGGICRKVGRNRVVEWEHELCEEVWQYQLRVNGVNWVNYAEMRCLSDLL